MKKNIFKALLCAGIVILSSASYSMTIMEIKNQILQYKNSIESLKADFTIQMQGLNKSNDLQKGFLSYTSGGGTVIEYKEPTPVKVEVKNSGAYYLNGKYQGVLTNSYQMADLFFEFYFNSYDLKLEKETEGEAYITGYEKTDDPKKVIRRKVLRMTFDKKEKTFKSIRYLGTGKDFPYEVHIAYQSIQEIPVIKTMTTLISAYSLSANSIYTLKNVSIQKK